MPRSPNDENGRLLSLIISRVHFLVIGKDQSSMYCPHFGRYCKFSERKNNLQCPQCDCRLISGLHLEGEGIWIYPDVEEGGTMEISLPDGCFIVPFGGNA